MKANQESVIAEWGITSDGGRLYEVERPFWLNVKDGPLEAVKKGDIVMLGQRTGQEMFLANKVCPIELGEIFEALADFRTINSNGEWLEVKRGDILKLSRDEALTLLRRREVKEKKGGETV